MLHIQPITQTNKAFPSARFYCIVSKSEVWELKWNKTHHAQFRRVFKCCMFFWNEMLPLEFHAIFRHVWMKQTAPSGVSLNFQCIGNAVRWVSSISSHNSHATSSFLWMCHLIKALFGCSQICINPHALGWIGVELNSTPTHVDWGESDNIQTRPKWEWNSHWNWPNSAQKSSTWDHQWSNSSNHI